MALLSDGGDGPMARIHGRFVREVHELCAKRIHNLLHGAAPQVGAADAACKERVPGEKLRRRDANFAGVVREIEAYAPRGVTGGMDHLCLERAPMQAISLFQQLIDLCEFRREHS